MAADDTTQGRAASGYEDFFEAAEPLWWKLKKKGGGVTWMTRHPGAADKGHHGQLADAHEVTEHEDGTITVSPSILCKTCGWHGYLEHGVWRGA